MKTFREWLELNEAGILSKLFGGRSQGAKSVQQPQIAQSEEEKEKDKQRKAHDDAMELLVPGYKQNAQPPMAQPSSSQPQQQNKPSTAKSGGATLFDQLYNLVGDKIIPIQKMRSESDHSLTIESNRSKIYEAYSLLSRAKNDGRNNGLSGSEIDKAISIIEKMFKDELGAITFPDEEVVVPYGKPDWDSKDYHINDAGASSLEGPAMVIVKGFKYGGKTVRAVVSMDAFNNRG
jgi:hypothetical protein